MGLKVTVKLATANRSRVSIHVTNDHSMGPVEISPSSITVHTLVIVFTPGARVYDVPNIFVPRVWGRY